MAIRIVPHAEDQKDAVEAFNRRMRDGGTHWGFYVDPVPTWIPKHPEAKAWREYYLAIEDDGQVRGGFALKPQQWLIRGETHWVTDWQGPVSEGAVNQRYGALGLRMIRDMLKKRPLLYSFGHGGDEQPIIQLLKKLNWSLHGVPFCFRVVNPRRFLLLNRYLRTTKQRDLALNALAWSGLGAVGMHGLHAALRVKSGAKRFTSSAQVEPTFGRWADQLWDRHASRYSALAVRDRAMMNTLVPERGWPSGIRLRVARRGETVGWVLVLHKRMQDEPRFGNLHMGLLADYFAAPELAGEVIHAGFRYLRSQGVDMVYANASHPGWIAGFEQNGFVIMPGRRLFAASPQLLEALSPFGETSRGLHLTNMDGHGPDGFD